jgi:formamidopyrimidine-DNA glycosylase
MPKLIISDLGNIYAREIVWAVQLASDRNASSLDAADYEGPATANIDFLTRAIAAG